MAPQLPVDFSPRLKLLEQLHHVHIEIPVVVAHMVADQLPPTIESYIAGYTVHVGLHRVGHTATAAHAPKQSRNAIEMPAQYFRIRFAQALH